MPTKHKYELQPISLSDQIIGERLATLRKSKGLTQDQLAAKIGITQFMVSRVESGRLQLTVDMLIRFSLALGIPAEEIIKSDPPPQPPLTPLRLSRRFKKIEALPPDLQKHILQSIDGALKMAGVTADPSEDESS